MGQETACNNNGKKKWHFILVHGAGHGAWCWYKLATMLASAGHRVTAPDLAACGVHPQRLDELGTIHDQLSPLMRAVASLPPAGEEGAILVGHSMGCIGISLAMEAFPEKIAAAVFVSGLMTNPGSPPLDTLVEIFRRTPPEDLLDCKFTFDGGPDNLPSSITYGPKFLSSKLYQCCQSEDLTLATMLVKPERYFLDDISSPTMLSEEKYGSVNRVYVVCREDQVIREEFQRWMVEKSPPVREVMEIEGADHMVMLSKPRELFNCLLLIAEKYA